MLGFVSRDPKVGTGELEHRTEKRELIVVKRGAEVMRLKTGMGAPFRRATVDP